MTTHPEMTERHARQLAELAELCLVSARDLAARQLAAADADAAVLASALHKVGRSLRQSLALEARLRRDQDQGAREVEARAVTAEQGRRHLRRTQVQLAVSRLIWTEGSDEAENLTDELTEMLDEDILAEGFGHDPLEAHIARIAETLGLVPDPPTSPEPSPEPTRVPPPIDDDCWRSSA